MSDPKPVTEAREPAPTPSTQGVTHDLKTWPAPFAAILDGSKCYEIRRDDRGFQVGDVLRLREWEPGHSRDEYGYTGREALRLVTHKTAGGEWGLPDDLCVLAIVPCFPPATTPTPPDEVRGLVAEARRLLDSVANPSGLPNVLRYCVLLNMWGESGKWCRYCGGESAKRPGENAKHLADCAGMDAINQAEAWKAARTLLPRLVAALAAACGSTKEPK